jgi:hypothetical protein
MSRTVTILGQAGNKEDIFHQPLATEAVGERAR